MNRYSNIDVYINDPEVYRLAQKGANLIIRWKGKEIKIPKIKNGGRKQYQKTESELKVLKLMPDDPPVGYGLQQFTGDIFYLYDITKTKKFELTDKEKLEFKNYRKELKLRKTCPKCNKVQSHLDKLGYRYLNDGQKYYSCPECYEVRDEEIKRERREVKHDFISYFVNKGINLNVPIDESESFDTVYLDLETTGLSATYDEIVQISIIDNKDRVLLYKLCKPIKQTTWDEAMRIHGITPKDVENELPFETYVENISSILLRSNTIVCYNCPFEIGFLDKYGVKYSKDNSLSKFKDCMIMFAKIYGEWNEYFEDYKWQSLSTAARYYKYNFEYQEHNSLADVFATKFVYEKMVYNP